MDPLRPQENADEASPAGAFPPPYISIPFLMVSLPPALLGVPRELGIIDGSLKPLFMQTASSVLPKSSIPGTGSRSGPED